MENFWQMVRKIFVGRQKVGKIIHRSIEEIKVDLNYKLEQEKDDALKGDY